MPRDITLALGNVRGHRGWFFDPFTGLLRAVSHPEHRYPFDVPRQVATCHRDWEARHAAPQENCTCGFYALYRSTGRNDVIAHTGTNGSVVLGSVKMSGKIVFGQSGVMRGERQEIEALLLNQYTPDHMSGFLSRYLAATYQVPVYPADAYEQFYVDFPSNPPELPESLPFNYDAELLKRWVQQLVGKSLLAPKELWANLPASPPHNLGQVKRGTLSYSTFDGARYVVDIGTGKLSRTTKIEDETDV